MQQSVQCPSPFSQRQYHWNLRCCRGRRSTTVYLLSYSTYIIMSVCGQLQLYYNELRLLLSHIKTMLLKANLQLPIRLIKVLHLYERTAIGSYYLEILGFSYF